MQELELFNESKEQLIKVFDVDKNTKIAYIINTLLVIINRWSNIRIYIYDIKDNDLEGGK